MLVYKYRGGSKEIFERDLKSIEQNIFWCSKFDQLNDPCETLMIKENKKKEANWLGRLLGKKELPKAIQDVNDSVENLYLHHKEHVGIYSLSKTYNDELLWAHYANSHKGFCIEYDLSLLFNNYFGYNHEEFSIIYSDEPPKFDFSHGNISKKEKFKNLAGYKSKRWENEEEYRIVVDLWGKYPYNYESLKAIYFGLRMDLESRELIMERLKGRGITYYEMIQVSNSYKFERRQIKERNNTEITYFKQVPSLITGNKKIDIDIFHKNFNRASDQANLTLIIDEKVEKPIIEWIANWIKNDLFSFANKLDISFYHKEKTKMYWAMASFKGKELKIVVPE